jgi:hypothetical protein
MTQFSSRYIGEILGYSSDPEKVGIWLLRGALGPEKAGIWLLCGALGPEKVGMAPIGGVWINIELVPVWTIECEKYIRNNIFNFILCNLICFEMNHVKLHKIKISFF